MENTNPKEILENIINVMEKTNVDEWEIDKLVVVLNYINELEKENEVLKKPIVENWENARTIKINNPLQQRIDKAIEYINSFEEDNPDYNSNFYNDGCCKNWIGFEDLVENTTKILRGETNE